MADIAHSAVLVPSSADIDLDALDPHRVPTAEGASEKEKVSRKAQESVHGPNAAFDSIEAILSCYPALGFQATHLGKAIALARQMLTKQPPSTVYAIQDGEFVKVEAEATGDEDDVYPTLFMGVTATLLGTGCREAVRFLVQEGVAPREAPDAHEQQSTTQINFSHLKSTAGTFAAQKLFPREALPGTEGFEPVGSYRSFLSALVVSGGGPEHDIRRACLSYQVDHYASETPVVSGQRRQTSRRATARHPKRYARFGNVLYPTEDATADTTTTTAPSTPNLFTTVMRTLVDLLCERQQELKEKEVVRSEQDKKNALLDGTAYCTWSVTPSEVWALAGLWLEDILTYALAKEATAAAHQHEPSKRASPKSNEEKHTDAPRDSAPAVESPHNGGDLSADDKEIINTEHAAAETFRENARRLAQSTILYWAARQEVPLFCPSFADGDMASFLVAHHACSGTLLKLDLVRDIHGINRMAMYSKRTGMLICGGGSVKHHVCNANLMRNGADYTVFISNGQEFDGSDAGARPEEAVSWGKIRCDGEAVKVYSEVSVVLPLLVAEVFVPAVRGRCQAEGKAPDTSCAK